MIANEIQSDGTGVKPQAMRRARARKSCSAEATIELLADGDGVCELPAKLVDMSDYGVGFETTSAVKVGSRVSISSRFFESSATACYRREAQSLVFARKSTGGANGYGQPCDYARGRGRS